MTKYDQLIFEISTEGSVGYSLPEWQENSKDIDGFIPKSYLRETQLQLPEVSENQAVRHYTLLSNKNYGVDTGFYPLGSCTMKYNPKINEDTSSMTGFLNTHPYQSEAHSQGSLELMYKLSVLLGEITGMEGISMQPAAGAHGELAGLMIMKAYHAKNGDSKRTKIICPDSAHGTNPASANVAGYDVVEVGSNPDGSVNIDALKAVLNDEVAGLMLTNPSTLGLFEKQIDEIQQLVHGAGGLLYYDGANMNAIMGKTRPGDMGFDIVHLNLHKTFSTPHGGGGPGSGPIGVNEKLKKFLPYPLVANEGEKYFLDYDRPDAIGRVKSYYGNFGMLVRAYTYILTLGSDGLKRASEVAVLNANYMQEQLKEDYYLPIDTVCKHEFVLGGYTEDEITVVSTLDIAKRLLDYGYHPPTIYFPLIVPQAMMIEPTESESLETIDEFIRVMKIIRKEIDENPDLLKNAPTNTIIRRVDEVKAARTPKLKWTKD